MSAPPDPGPVALDARVRAVETQVAVQATQLSMIQADVHSISGATQRLERTWSQRPTWTIGFLLTFLTTALGVALTALIVGHA